MCDLLAAPPQSDLPGEDLYGLGRFYQDLEQLTEAEAAFAQAAATCHSPLVREMAKRDLAYLLKRQERREEALPWWQQLVETEGAVYACEELAKHYEWHAPDLDQALAWTERAIALVEAWPRGPKRRDLLAELVHRQARLARKQALPEGADYVAAEL